ncbi:MAG: type II secretion system F family protein [Acetatifactor sp.]|nr:type II secretion system F family protein [Acetatifactor sp.]
MEEGAIIFLLRVLPVCAGILVLLILGLLSCRITPEIILRTYEELSGLLRAKGKSAGWYEQRAGWLKKNGASAHFGKWVNPVKYLAMQIMLFCTGFAGVLKISTGMAVIFGGILFWLPEVMLIYLNKRDNEKLLGEIKLVYQSLEIQIGAGIYVTDALAECHGCVQNLRLSEALLELAGDIVMKADIYDALNSFQSKFDNRYIDALCITILQALESGQALELLRDISEQIRDMEGTMMEKKKGALDRKITFYQLGVLTVVMGVVIYACITHMYTVTFLF